MKVIRGGQEIRTLDEWRNAMPKRLRERQWKERRSAMELARAWIAAGGPAVPSEIRALLESSPAFAWVEVVEAQPEVEVTLDAFRGGTRNTDLLLLCRQNGQALTISVEAKADESFGPTIGEYLRRLKEKPRSKAPTRIQQLSQAVFGVLPDEVGDLRYQLLHAVAGALIVGAGQDRTLLVVHEFRSGECDAERLADNQADLNAFARRLGAEEETRAGVIVGPFRCPGGGSVPSDVELFIGKAVREQRNG